MGHPRPGLTTAVGRTELPAAWRAAEQTVRTRIARDMIRRSPRTDPHRKTRSSARSPHSSPDRATAAGRTRMRRADRRQVRWRDRRDRRFATDAKLARLAGSRPDTRILRTHRPPPPRPRRQPPTQLRTAPLAVSKGRWTPTPPPTSPANKRRQEPPRSAAMPQTPPRPPRVATSPASIRAPSRPSTPTNDAITVHCNTPNSRFALT